MIKTRIEFISECVPAIKLSRTILLESSIFIAETFANMRMPEKSRSANSKPLGRIHTHSITDARTYTQEFILAEAIAFNKTG